MGTTKLNNKKGAALLTVLVALLLISLMTLELQYTSLVERKLAYNDLNQLQAHYLAKSGVHLGLLRLILYGKARNDDGLKACSRFFNLAWSLPFPPFPPDAESLSKLNLQEKSEQEEAIKDTRISQGQFSYSISSESSKLNLNLLSGEGLTGTPDFRKIPENLVEYIGFNLLHRIEQILKESDTPDEDYGVFRPESVVYNIMDWITPSNTSFGASDKDAWYEQQNPPYKAKRARFFTLDELKLVKDVSPPLFYKLKPMLTVFSENGRIDLDAATKNGDLKYIFPDLNERDIQAIRTRFHDLGDTWGKVSSFRDFLRQLDIRSYQRYPDNQYDNFFSIGGENFILKSIGQIKKSGTTVQSSITVSVALTTPTGGCPEIGGVKTMLECSTRGGFFHQAGKCYAEPTTATACRECKTPEGLPLANLATQTQCQVFGQSNKSPGQEPYSINFSSTPATPTTVVQKFNQLKVYSWVES